MKNDIPNILFLAQIYYMKFITSPSIPSEDFPATLRSIFADYSWRTFLVVYKKIHISEYVSKTCLKELGILLKCRETFENLFAAATLRKILVFKKLFVKFSDNGILRTSISYQKPKGVLC